MTLIRKNIVLARTSNALFFDAGGHPALDASDLDFYLFNREARMDEVWGTERARVVGRMGSDRIQPATAPGCAGFESENQTGSRGGRRFDVLLNNPGISIDGDLTDLDLIQKHVDVSNCEQPVVGRRWYCTSHTQLLDLEGGQPDTVAESALDAPRVGVT